MYQLQSHIPEEVVVYLTCSTTTVALQNPKKQKQKQKQKHDFMIFALAAASNSQGRKKDFKTSCSVFQYILVFSCPH